MDRPRTLRLRTHFGLPRTRGDGPGPRRCVRVQVWASPHTRGWTRLDRRSGHSDPGFPAHAGMDPVLRFQELAQARLPRTRGDGPRPLKTFDPIPMASPHTRGWTPPTGGGWVWADGFPAHAGMDPHPYPGGADRWWLPRTRGDGPSTWQPRPTSRPASPHTRGWTPGVPRVIHDDSGFPAHAGMDPGRSTRERTIAGLPRTRGDGPGLRGRHHTR